MMTCSVTITSPLSRLSIWPARSLAFAASRSASASSVWRHSSSGGQFRRRFGARTPSRYFFKYVASLGGPPALDQRQHPLRLPVLRHAWVAREGGRFKQGERLGSAFLLQQVGDEV